ncbi:hypothetical protein [Streptomyces albofaciens]|nr:hypothetical protein [Streptomyces albofaciens]
MNRESRRKAAGPFEGSPFASAVRAALYQPATVATVSTVRT